MLPPITLQDLDRFVKLRDTSHALPVEPWAGELPHDTQVKVGVLRVQASSDTHVEVVEADRKATLVTWNGARAVGLPAGSYGVQIAGETKPVTVTAGKITDF